MRKYFKSSTVIFVLFCLKCQAVDYCQLPCGDEDNRREHTVCTYPTCAKAGCEKFRGAVTAADKNYAVQLHNEIRNEFAIKMSAANMMAISYDDDLEFTAQCWANQCSRNPPHDKCRRTEKYETAGQNMWTGTTAKTARKIAYRSIQVGWYDGEVGLVPADAWEKFHLGDQKYGHCTQVVWATSEAIGCAYSTNLENHKHFYYCNYGPAGNINTEAAFIKGKPASKCPDGLSPNSMYPALCGEITPATSSSSKSDNILLAYLRYYSFIIVLIVIFVQFYY